MRVTVTTHTGGLLAQIRTAEVKSLALAAEHVLQVSRTRVPIEEDTLERSGLADVDAGALVAAVSYDTVYAVVQHEDLTMRHDDGRQAKFLESALADSRDEVGEIIAAQVRRALR